MEPTSVAQDTMQTTAGMTGLGLGVVIFVLLVFVLAYALFAYILGRIFKKAGEDAWKAWVPVYNSWVFLEIGGQKGVWAVLGLIPPLGIVTFVFSIIAAIKIGEKLGKPGAFVLLYVFVSYVWLIWLAFDSSTWASDESTSDATSQTPVFAPAAEPSAQQIEGTTPTSDTTVAPAVPAASVEQPLPQPTSVDGITPAQSAQETPVAPQDTPNSPTPPRQ